MVKKQIITAATFGGKKNFFFALKKKSTSQPSAIPLLTNLKKFEGQTHVKIAFFFMHTT